MNYPPNVDLDAIGVEPRHQACTDCGELHDPNNCPNQF